MINDCSFDHGECIFYYLEQDSKPVLIFNILLIASRVEHAVE